uniref:Uncharacterized protein n=1 Tax=Aegilops tauschii subsp. strangulata TaxID=200361 RepID=A0A453IY96_AEGTS
MITPVFGTTFDSLGEAYEVISTRGNRETLACFLAATTNPGDNDAELDNDHGRMGKRSGSWDGLHMRNKFGRRWIYEAKRDRGGED